MIAQRTSQIRIAVLEGAPPQVPQAAYQRSLGVLGPLCGRRSLAVFVPGGALLSGRRWTTHMSSRRRFSLW